MLSQNLSKIGSPEENGSEVRHEDDQSAHGGSKAEREVVIANGQNDRTKVALAPNEGKFPQEKSYGHEHSWYRRYMYVYGARLP